MDVSDKISSDVTFELSSWVIGNHNKKLTKMSSG